MHRVRGYPRRLQSLRFLLPATGACGICVVKLEGNPNMVRACTTPVEAGMRVRTHDPELIRIRRTMLELILSAHPNECLSCGRNGTCELQKLAAGADFPVELLKPVKVSSVTEARNIHQADYDVVMLYPATPPRVGLH